MKLSGQQEKDWEKESLATNGYCELRCAVVYDTHWKKRQYEKEKVKYLKILY